MERDMTMCPYKWLEAERLRRRDQLWVPSNPCVRAKFMEAARQSVLRRPKYNPHVNT
jgi:hypothetical protein